jgi:hypothetical protein
MDRGRNESPTGLHRSWLPLLLWCQCQRHDCDEVRAGLRLNVQHSRAGCWRWGATKHTTNKNGVEPNAVFTAYAPASDPKIAIGVMIQGGGYGSAAAAPIAVAVIKAYLAS